MTPSGGVAAGKLTTDGKIAGSNLRDMIFVHSRSVNFEEHIGNGAAANAISKSGWCVLFKYSITHSNGMDTIAQLRCRICTIEACSRVEQGYSNASNPPGFSCDIFRAHRHGYSLKESRRSSGG